MIRVQKVIRWDEPFTDDYKEGVINEATPEAIIKRWRETHKKFKGKDSEALFEFMVVYWAWEVIIIDVSREYPSLVEENSAAIESHFPLST